LLPLPIPKKPKTAAQDSRSAKQAPVRRAVFLGRAAGRAIKSAIPARPKGIGFRGDRTIAVFYGRQGD